MPRHTALFLALAQVGAVSVASAATITVDSAADTIADDGACTLREAITNANGDSALSATAGECAAGSGDDSIELPAGQTITLASSLAISSNISVIGNGARVERSGSCNLDGTTDSGEFRLITANDGGDTISLSNFTLANGCADGSGSAGRGGGLYSFTNYLSLQDMRFEGNQAKTYGGALSSFAEGISSLAISDSVFSGNTAGSQGGAIRSNSVSPLIEDCTFSNNVAAYGGAIHHRYGNPTINRSTFSGNSASGQGGALSFRRHPASPGQVLTLGSSTLDGNTADKGGGIYAAGSVSLHNSTVSGNSATSGGGFHLSTLGGLAMSDSSAIDNSGAGGSQIFWSEGSTVDVRRSLLVGSSPACNTASTAASGSDSLATDASCNVVGASVVTRAALQLQALSNQGGSTKIHPLGHGSVAIDAGGTACSGSDQRGETRLFGSACDVGAFEVNETSPSGSDFVVNALGDAGDGFCGTESGECTLRDAVLAANSDDDSSTISFDAGLFSGVNTLTLASGQLRISAPLTLTGPGSDRLTIDANGASRHFDIERPSFPGTAFLVTLSDLRLINGVISGDGGGSIKSFENTVLRNLILENNESAQVGGAIWIQVDTADAGQVRLEAVTVQNNSAPSGGGGAHLSVAGSDGQISVSDSLFVANLANASGGGLHITGNDETIEISNSEFRSNVTSSSGSMTGAGLVASLQDSTATIQNSRFLDNRTEIGDGSGAGLGIIVDGGSLVMSDLTVSGNSASGTIYTGGGLYLSTSKDGTAVLRRSEVSNNSSNGSAGGIRASLYDTSSISIEGSTIAGNTAGGDGGGIWSYLYAPNTQLSLVDSTLAGNQANASGGGLFAYPYVDGPVIELRGSTVTDNSADADNNASGVGGGMSFEARGHGSVSLQGSVVAGNRDLSESAADWFDGGQTLAVSHSLIGNNAGTPLTEAQTADANNNLIGSATTPIDPQLGALADNGGSTKTHRPSSSSPLLDHYTGCSGNDQRGQARGSDLDGTADNDCDIGALEFQYTAIVAQGETEGPVAEDAVAASFDNLLNNEIDPADDYSANFEVVEVAGSATNRNVELSVSGALFTIAANGGAVFKPNGAFEALDDGEIGSIAIDYTVSDGQRSDAATLTVNVAGANDAPVSSDGAIITTEDSVGSVVLGVTDVDVEAQTLSQVSAPSAGTVSFDSANLIARFNPNAQFEALDDGESQQVTFTYKANDGTVDSNVSTVTVTINGANDAPLAQNDAYTVQGGETLSIAAAAGLLANDSDVDIEDLVVTSTGTVTPDGVGGSLTLNADGSFSYVAPEQEGSASFTYTVSDGSASTAGTVTFTVSGFPTAELSISKDDGKTVVSAGDVLTYTITVHNAGPANAQGVRVLDTLPSSLGNASWSCEAVMPSASTACGASSGTGSIDELVNIGSGDSVVYELMTTVDAGFTEGEIANTATVTPPANRSDSNTANNTATDRNDSNRIFSEGFEDRVVTKRFDGCAMVLDAPAIEQRLPLDAGYKPVLVARAVSKAGASDLVLVHARRFEGALQVKLGRWVDGEWSDSGWVDVVDQRIELNW